ncbi:hypothetical protein PHYBLDRAFT_72463 [Phycomyces blakesleeanus NRRL 1555(-)]|uniref:Uncharacterized protein n=1 Tax=Phycomyces blakesleeanus (strain ATCC 8743b / DSM 1359 / FGSC 10004 / NBRC 33097 / NRRL 1555) TaxID=763407 RepID=A0A167J7K3_PHYB8|nr:hypothetical protein PHYBLDRAFT_72463 [Phycomyces blakesleeanus NRRL 1555(-)]OAD65399.1 hypothetical protein PHYBLDRAFT_72463 [Phycomyces blakesleeanus NRRL 1555(-)]|eukprot:XP_018283439.1 hypothetical protein PHYBLDRAFT_72463 [Phycomyces blakesleeanus NRRL 1555(-)]
MDYYDSCSSDEENQCKNNPRLTDIHVDSILFEERINQSKAETSDADNEITGSTIHIETHMRVLKSFSTSMNDYAARVTASESSHQSIEDIFILTRNISPFKSKAEFILHALFHGDEDLASEILIKKIMYTMEMLLEHIMTCLEKTSQLSALPDFTENQRLHLNQGNK